MPTVLTRRALARTGSVALQPRQPITPTPYAVTALNVPGVSGSSLNSANDGPLNVVVVDNFGKVGVGTTSPQETLDVRSGDGSYVRVDSVNGDIKVNGGSDGHFGIFNDGPSSGGTHLIGEGQSRLFVANAGKVGIGTTTPMATLDVRGDIRLGFSGQLRATSGEENLRVIRGSFTAMGTILFGSGFSVSSPSTGVYRIGFDDSDDSFINAPVLMATTGATGDPAESPAIITTKASGASAVFLRVLDPKTLNPVNRTIQFIAVGPR
jgi:hypothetical protein